MDKDLELYYLKQIKELVSHDRGNFEACRSLLESFDNIVPYIGAGMAAKFSPLWGELINDAKDRLIDEKKEANTKFKNALYSEDPCECAQAIADIKGYPLFIQTIKGILKERELSDADYEEKLKNEAINLIPKFRNKWCLTTNVDLVIDKVYQLSPLVLRDDSCRISPMGDNINVDSAERDHSKVIFKIHGDINDADMIFAEEAYKRYYENTEFASTVKSFLIRMYFLFLGCSFTDGRPLSLIKEVLKESIRFRKKPNFAIIESKVKNKGDNELLHYIIPITYNSDETDCHRWVKIILDLMFEWRKENKDWPNTVLDLDKKIDELMEKNYNHAYDDEFPPVDEYIGGTQNYIELVNGFLEYDRLFLWWEIAGSAGSGKTRLCKEIERIESGRDWDVVMLDYNELKETVTNQNSTGGFNKNKLIIIDDADLCGISEEIDDKEIDGKKYTVAEFAMWVDRLKDKQRDQIKFRIIFVSQTGKPNVNSRWWQNFDKLVTCKNSLARAGAKLLLLSNYFRYSDMQVLEIINARDMLFNLAKAYSGKIYGVPDDDESLKTFFDSFLKSGLPREPLPLLVSADICFLKGNFDDNFEDVRKKLLTVDLKRSKLGRKDSDFFNEFLLNKKKFEKLSDNVKQHEQIKPVNQALSSPDKTRDGGEEKEQGGRNEKRP